MSEIYVGKTIIKNAITGETKAYELSKDSYDYLEYEAKRVIGLEKRVEELERENIGLKQDLKNVTEQLESVSDVVWKGDSDD